MRRRRGFTLVEMVTALAVMAVLVGVSMPYFGRAARKNALRTTSQSLADQLLRAKALAAGGYRPGSPWSPSERTRNAGLVVASPSTYYLFVDRDGQTDGDEIIVRTHTLPLGMVFSAPAVGTELRFHQNGTLVQARDFALTDTHTGMQRAITVAAGGFARVN